MTPRPPSDLLSLEGKIALVTGGAGGIGSAVVAQLQEAGAEVISVDLADRTAPPPARSWPCDLADPAALRALARRLGEETDRLDVLVHAGGITRDARLWKMTDEEWSAVLRVNLDSAFHLLRDLSPLLRESKDGAVVLISSINGERGKIGQANYAASKGGLIALGKTAARELASSGVRVNTIAPGLIRTAMTERIPAEWFQRAVDETLLGRAGEPADVAAATLFLCSRMSRHITGQVLRVDGGQLVA